MRYIVCLAAVLALAIPTVATALPSVTANPANKLLSRGIDPIQYDPATHCNGGHIPVGTKAMLAWLERNANGVNWGEYRCEIWGKHSASLHSAGRAIDWHPTTMKDGYALVKLLLAPDKAGNVAALARRMGVQGLIFNCKAWFGSWDGQMGDYSYCYDKKGRRKHNLDPTQAHMNHVHIELNLRGAAEKTTFWNPHVRYPLQDQAPAPAPAPAPTAPAPAPAQPQPQPQPQPWQGNPYTGGGQYDNTGGA
jgi:hypothetical protein